MHVVQNGRAGRLLVAVLSASCTSDAPWHLLLLLCCPCCLLLLVVAPRQGGWVGGVLLPGWQAVVVRRCSGELCLVYGPVGKGCCPLHSRTGACWDPDPELFACLVYELWHCRAWPLVQQDVATPVPLLYWKQLDVKQGRYLLLHSGGVWRCCLGGGGRLHTHPTHSTRHTRCRSFTAGITKATLGLCKRKPHKAAHSVVVRGILQAVYLLWKAPLGENGGLCCGAELSWGRERWWWWCGSGTT
jgi:hypothetical protein